MQELIRQTPSSETVIVENLTPKKSVNEEDTTEFAAANEIAALPDSLDAATLHGVFRFAARLHLALNQHDAARIALEAFDGFVAADDWTIACVNTHPREVMPRETDETICETSNTDRLTFENLAVYPLRVKADETANDIINPLDDVNQSMARQALADAAIIERHDARESRVVVPLVCGSRIVAVLCAGRSLENNQRRFAEAEIELLRSLAAPLAHALANAARIAEAERLSQSDDLTNLHNARYLRDYLLNEIRRARRYGSSVAVLFLDLDNFKSVNDNHGHLVGSYVLIEVAAAILAAVRDTDVVARYGGDEFVVVLPETDDERALQVAERVRATLAQRVFAGGRNLKLNLTASFGVAAYPAHANSAHQLLSVADRAMYEAKAARKNCVRPAHFERFDLTDEGFIS